MSDSTGSHELREIVPTHFLIDVHLCFPSLQFHTSWRTFPSLSTPFPFALILNRLGSACSENSIKSGSFPSSGSGV
jgi:hypothetical protein